MQITLKLEENLILYSEANQLSFSKLQWPVKVLWASVSRFCILRAGTSNCANAGCIKYSAVLFWALFREYILIQGLILIYWEKNEVAVGNILHIKKIQQELKINLWLNGLAF